jgi:hypothetical protein
MLSSAGVASAASIVDNYSHNGGIMYREIVAGVGGLGADPAVDSDTPARTNISLPSMLTEPPGAPVVNMPAATAQIVPTSVTAKDIAEVTASAVFEYGSPHPGSVRADDFVSFSVDGTLSAVDAVKDAGNDANAFVTALMGVVFFVDQVFGVSVDDVIGQFDLDGLRELEAWEVTYGAKLRVEVTEDDTTLLHTVNPGDEPSSVDARVGHFYYDSARNCRVLPRCVGGWRRMLRCAADSTRSA